MGELSFNFVPTTEPQYLAQFKYWFQHSIKYTFAYRRYISLSDTSIFNSPVAITKVATGLSDLYDLFVDKLAYPITYKELIKNKNLMARVLPTSEVLISCENLGFNADNIIAMKGPFTQEMNESTYKQYNIDLVITKESGAAGGFLEKVNACKTLNIPVVIMKRKEMHYPNTIGTVERLVDLVKTY